MSAWDGLGDARMSVGGALLVAGAGFVAGAANAAAGGGTLVTFPALLAAGQSALTANITSSVGLLAGYTGGSIAYRRELVGQHHRVRRLSLAGVIGGVGGAILLVSTPTDAFRSVVPFLVIFACALLLIQPPLSRWVARRRAGQVGPDVVPVSVVATVLFGAVYGSYFGAGLSVVLLALFGILLEDSLQRLNALKGVVSLVINAAGVAVFLVTGKVAWGYAGIIAVTAFAGAHLGVGIARRLPPVALRLAIVTLGLAVAITMLVRG
jgi:hypothetical protein